MANPDYQGGRRDRDGGDERRETSNLFLANIPSGSNEDDVIKVFEKYGRGWAFFNVFLF